MKRVFLSGIGGIGMANLAVLLKEAGFEVSGSDGAVYEPAASILRIAGIEPKTPYSADNVPNDGTTVIIGNVQSRRHVEIEQALNLNIPLWSFPEFLHRHVMSNRHRMVVAGTHGKSSTTACLAHVLQAAHIACGFLAGALPVGPESGAALGESSAPFVLEGDEYDTAFFDKRSKFLHYFPHTLLLGTVEYDHADIFASLEEMLVAFRRLIMLLPSTGALIYNADCAQTSELAKAAACRTISVGKTDRADYQLLPDSSQLSFRFSGSSHSGSFSLPGEHQRYNALMALAAAQSFAPNLDAYLNELVSFRGLRRRLEKLFDSQNLIVYDDFAHHPTAIAATLLALREHHPQHRLIAVIEPRSNTMVRNIFQHELPRALSSADHVIIGNIHRLEKIPPAERLDLTAVFAELNGGGAKAVQIPNGEILHHLAPLTQQSPSCVVFMSNGGFENIPHDFVHMMNRQAT